MTRPLGRPTVRKNSGVDVGSRNRINLIEGANVTLTVLDDGGSEEIDVTITSAAAGGTIVVRKNGGADVGTRPRLNFIEGANITLTVADDAVDGEIDITVASAGGGSGDISQYFPAVDPDTFIGTHPALILPDARETSIRQSFMIPRDITTIDQASVIVVTAATGDLRWSCATTFGALNVPEDYDNHTDSIAATDTGCTVDRITVLDITAALTGAAALDLVGITFTRHGDHANDTIDAAVYYIGIYVEGS